MPAHLQTLPRHWPLKRPPTRCKPFRPPTLFCSMFFRNVDTSPPQTRVKSLRWTQRRLSRTGGMVERLRAPSGPDEEVSRLVDAVDHTGHSVAQCPISASCSPGILLATTGHLHRHSSVRCSSLVKSQHRHTPERRLRRSQSERRQTLSLLSE